MAARSWGSCAFFEKTAGEHVCLDGGGCERYERVACETRLQGGGDDDGGDDGGHDTGPEAPLVNRGGDMSTESQLANWQFVNWGQAC